MPFFKGAYNFTINNANMVDGSITNTNITYVPTVDPWALSTRLGEGPQRVDDLPDPEIDKDWPFSKQARTNDTKVGPNSEATQPRSPQRLQYILRQIYLALLLRLPALYLSRFNQITEEASLSFREMKDLAYRTVLTEDFGFEIVAADPNQKDPEPKNLPPSYQRLKYRWEAFIDILLNEWTTLNIVSALLVPGVLTMFQIAGGAAADPVTRYLSFWSLISALLSLLYGCMFIVRFSRMRKPYIIIEWAVTLQRPGFFNIFWNVPVMLAMPFLWLTWSIVLFLVCIMWFMWRVGTPPPGDDANFPVPHNATLGFRIFLCATLGIGLFYGGLTLITFHQYGEKLNKRWKQRLMELLESARKEKQSSQAQTPDPNSRSPSPGQYPPSRSQNLPQLSYQQGSTSLAAPARSGFHVPGQPASGSPYLNSSNWSSQRSQAGAPNMV